MAKLNVLNFMQWNAQSLRPKLKELELLLSHEKVHICILSETWLEPESFLSISGYNIFRQDRIDSYGGVALVIHSSIKCQSRTFRPINSGIQIVQVKLFNCDFVENVVSIYCPSTIHTTRHDWDNIFSEYSSRSIIAGDFNAHHSNWSNRTDSRGTHIFDCLIDNNFVSLNDSSPTRIKLVNGRLQKSSPDITFVSADIALKFNWKVMNENFGSDHLIIKFSSNIAHTTNNSSKWNFKKADWKSYSLKLQDSFSNRFCLGNDIQLDYNSFLDILVEAADENIPKIKICNSPLRVQDFKPKPYWNADISKAVAERRLALASFRRNPTPLNLEQLQLKVSSAQRMIRKARNKAWQEFCSSVDKNISASEMWRRMRWLKGYRQPRAQIDFKDAEKMMRGLCPDYVSPSTPSFDSINDILDSQITLTELEHCIKCKDTAPGDDGISFSMIMNIPTVGKQALIELYSKFLTLGFVPYQWRKVKLVAIPKSGGSSTNPAFRPIALMSCLCKIFHSILKNRIEWFLEQKSVFSRKMVGFRKTRSCLDSLAELVSNIQLSFAKNDVTVACFIDIDSAYNNVDIVNLVQTLDRLCLGRGICRYIFEFLNFRDLSITTADSKYISRCTAMGLAQGDPLSPILFNIATYNICHLITSVNISQYADDFVIYTSAKHSLNAVDNIQTSLYTISNLISRLGLDISSRKTCVCLFSRGFRRYNHIIELNGHNIKQVQSVKYLGLWLDSSLKWGKHINEMYEKSSAFINIFKVLGNTRWGVHPKHLRRLYIALIRSRLDYGSFLYDTAVKNHLNKLDKLQNCVMRVIGSFIRSTPIYVMESELSLQPLMIRRRYLASKYIIKARSFQNNAILNKITELATLCESNRYWRNKKPILLVDVYNHIKDTPVQACDILEMFTLETWVSNIDLSNIVVHSIESVDKSKRRYKSSELYEKCSVYLTENYPNFYRIFTDGSKSGDGIGAAFFDSQANVHGKFKITSNLSIMFVELLAIAEAMSYCFSLDKNKFVILTDSKSALQHVARCTSSSRGSPIGYTILDMLLKFAKSNKTIVLQWIPSHIGILGNEEADRLANVAITDGIPTQTLPFYTDLLPKIKLKCYDMWKEYFDERSQTLGIWYRTIQSHPTHSPWFDTSELTRRDIVTALRLRSGHIPLNKFAFLMKKVDSPNCTECGVIEDVYHIIVECVRNCSVREQLYIDNSLQVTGGCNSILARPNSDKAKILYKIVNFGLSARFNSNR